ncbi:MAG: phospholipase D family protein [Methylococcales bacterium]|nr:phospholipase D family protein [Methylococcales bacterium]
MAKFLNTSATNYFLEGLIKTAKERLVLMSPFLKLNDKIKELLEDKNRLKIDVRIIYGKNELQNDEITWLNELPYIKTSFCKNLHAKCYLNENVCIITSLNLYEFSQVNNNEMGIIVSRKNDVSLYKDAYEESQRIIRISDEIKKTGYPKLTTSKLAQKLGKTTTELTGALILEGYLKINRGVPELTEKSKKMGAEQKEGRFGTYFLWNKDFKKT